MIYRGIEITAEIETYEAWDIDEHGRPTEFISSSESIDVVGYFFQGDELGIYEFVSASETDLAQLKKIADDFIKDKGADDYAHCKTCDKAINLDRDVWHTDGNNTYCESEKGTK